MSEGSYSSLFDMAGKGPKKKPEQKEEAEKKAEGEKKIPEGVPEIKTPEDMKAAFEHAKKMHDELKRKIDSAYEKANISPRQVKEYIDNPKHFQQSVWNAIEKTKKEIQEKLQKLMPRGPAEKEEEQPPEAPPEGKKPPPKKPKGGGLTGKRRWLTM